MKNIIENIKDFFSDIKGYIIFSAILFVVLVAAVWILIGRFDFLSVSAENFLEEAFAGVLSAQGETSAMQDSLNIMLNNLRAFALDILVGIVPFIFLPFFYLIINAALIATVGHMIAADGLNVFIAFLAGMLPHGIIELPLIILSNAIGIYLCVNTTRLVLHSWKARMMSEVLRDVFFTALLIIVPLTAVAAFIEGYITPWIINLAGL